jgi:hypothetical protein
MSLINSDYYSLNTVENALSQTKAITQKVQHVSQTSLKEQIQRKKSPQPYFANVQTVLRQLTDKDHGPYQRFSRDEVGNPTPITYERLAGFSPLQPTCYYSEGIITPFGRNANGQAGPYHRVPSDTAQGQSTYPDNCFQPACTTILPCKNSDPNIIHTTVLKI